MNTDDQPTFQLRKYQPGDIDWVVYRHGVLYEREYGWGIRFETLVADVAAWFLKHNDPSCERCWIAVRDDSRLGCVMLVREDVHTARLRFLLVEPEARGFGVGRRLIRECTQFARQAGYHRIVLWTNSNLLAARRLYEQEGYQLIRSEAHELFGENLVGETWELIL